MLSGILMAGEFGFPSRLPEVHGGGDSGAGFLGVLDNILRAVERGIEGGGPSWNPVAGIEALGSNLHPMIVHFPIAFLFGFFLFEALGLVRRQTALRQVASGMLYLGAVGAVLAATAGIIAGRSVPHGAAVHEIMEWHERLGLTVAGLSVALALWRALGGLPTSTMAKAFHICLAVVVGICLFVGADLGGLMVYQHGVGVKSLQDATDAVQHQHAGAMLSEPAGSQPENYPVPTMPNGRRAAEPPVLKALEPASAQEHSHHHHHHH